MINIDLTNISIITKIEVICDKCTTTFIRTLKNVKVSRKKHNCDLCKDCSYKVGASKRPQNNKNYWTDEKKEEHGELIKNNENYINGLKNREDCSGENNSMFGKIHSIISKQKMSISRTGKTGVNATAWKGGINTLCRRIKSFQYRNGWYKKIYERDLFKCVKCNSKKQIEVHHIKPMKIIINEVKNNFKTEDEVYDYLILQDINLSFDNEITLCRECHKKEHINWGSHIPQIITK